MISLQNHAISPCGDWRAGVGRTDGKATCNAEGKDLRTVVGNSTAGRAARSNQSLPEIAIRKGEGTAIVER